MAVDSKKMMQSIYDALHGALTGSVPNFRVARSIPENQSFVTLLTPALGIDPQVYTNAWSPLNPEGSDTAARALAQLVENVPRLHPQFTSAGRLEDFYEEIVRAEVDPPPVNDAAEAALRAAEDLLFDDGIEFDESTGEPITVKNSADSPMYRNYKNKQILFEGAMMSYLAEWQQIDPNNAADKTRWAVMAPIYESRLRVAFADFETSRPGRIREAQAVLGQSRQTSLVRRFQEARQAFELGRRGDLGGGGSFLPVQAFPANWATSTSLTPLSINSSDIHTSSSSSWGSWGGSAGVDLGLFSIGGGGGQSWSNHNLHQSTTNLQISFDFLRVDIRRPWFKESLLSTTNWDIEGRPKNAYSTGKAEVSNKGVFPLVTQSFVLARNFRAQATWAESDRQMLTRQTQGSGGVRIGPFRFGGGGGSSSTSNVYRASFNGVQLSSPSAQIIAYLNSVNPACPPK